MAWNAGVLKMPVWAFHGAEDETVSVTQTDEMIEQLRKFNTDVTYTRIEGARHDIAARAYTKELLEWLLSKKRI